MADDKKEVDNGEAGDGDDGEEVEEAVSSKEKKEKKSKKNKKEKKKKESDSEEESEQDDSEDEKQKKKKDRNKKKTKGSKEKKEDTEFMSIYQDLDKEQWEHYDTPSGCLKISQMKGQITAMSINEPAIFDRDGKYYRWARLGEKGSQQMLIGPLYFLSMGDLSTEQYGESYFYCAVPKKDFPPLESALTKQLQKAQKNFKAKGSTPFVKKEVSYKLPALERFRMGLIDAPAEDDDDDAKLTTESCTLVQFPLSISDPNKFTVTCGSEELILRDVFERLPGVIGYANVTVLFSAEVPGYVEGESGESEDDDKKKKKKGSSSRKKSKSHKSKQQDPMDPGASSSKVSVKFKVSSISIVGQTIAKAVPMSESTTIEPLKPSSGLISIMNRR